MIHIQVCVCVWDVHSHKLNWRSEDEKLSVNKSKSSLFINRLSLSRTTPGIQCSDTFNVSLLNEPLGMKEWKSKKEKVEVFI